ncbi:hypothetical protein DBV39_10320 [Orrella marina]|uniref:Uncharacterized protein n=1 Tax=Orrella marina TaxID=2163011 RepID=A0A2R4XJV2_9BURK|nr:hypothetical protein DBV39_10320 [Orrella marina]
MGAHLRVQVPLRAGHSEQSEAQLRKGDRSWKGSVERKLRADEQKSHTRNWNGEAIGSPDMPMTAMCTSQVVARVSG